MNTKNILKDDIVPIMGYLLSKLDPNVIDENVLLGIDLLIKAAKDLQDPALLRNIYQHVLFHFKVSLAELNPNFFLWVKIKCFGNSFLNQIRFKFE